MGDTRIHGVRAWEALDSRGNPTVACTVTLGGGAVGTAIVPSGASTGSHEAHELRDGGARYAGLGVTRAARNAEVELGAAAAGADAADQGALDATLRLADGSPNLTRLGANAVLAVSIAAARAAAAATGQQLYEAVAGEREPLMPLPMVNILSGGAHAGWALDVQDCLAVPVGAARFSEAIEWAGRVRRAAAELARGRGLVSTLVADEGGLGPQLDSTVDALELLTAAIEQAGLKPLEQVALAVDVAATQWLDGPAYRPPSRGRTADADELLSEIAHWADRFPLVSVEDPLGEDDWDGWREATRRLGDLQLLGDDLFATDDRRLQRGIDAGIANAVLVKPNQTGTLSGARAVVERAAGAGYATVLSARSGDTEDSWLADIAVGWRTGQIKVGSTTRAERTAKWNRLLQIEAEREGEIEFAGRAALAPLAARAA